MKGMRYSGRTLIKMNLLITTLYVIVRVNISPGEVTDT